MSDKGDSTRNRIVKAAETLVLNQGYAGMSLDDVLRATGLTKGAFFHHFRNKAELGRAVIENYADGDYAMFSEWSARADRLSDDPYERVMIFLRLFEEFLEQLDQPPKGCIFASYVYEHDEFGADIHDYIRDRMMVWQRVYEAKFAALIAARPPAIPATAKSLAEMITAMVQGSFVMANALGEREYMLRQARSFRQYMELLFKRPTR